MIYEALIVDDEAPARAELKTQLEQTGRVMVVSEAVSVQEAIIRLGEQKIDIAFLDCNTAGAGSTMLKDALPGFLREPVFINMAAFRSGDVAEPFGINPIGHLKKPIDKAKLDELLDKVDELWKAVRVS